MGTAAWGVISYGVSALFVGYGLWNAPFIVLGGLFLLSAIFFLFAALNRKKYPAAIANAIKTASISRNKPAILSPVNKSLRALVKPIPGIKVIILPIIILSALIMILYFNNKKVNNVIITVERNLLKILFEIIISEK